MISNPLVIPIVVIFFLYIAIQVKPLHIELIYYRAFRLYILIDYSYNIYIYIYIYICIYTSCFGPVYVRIFDNYELLLENCMI